MIFFTRPEFAVKQENRIFRPPCDLPTGGRLRSGRKVHQSGPTVSPPPGVAAACQVVPLTVGLTSLTLASPIRQLIPGAWSDCVYSGSHLRSGCAWNGWKAVPSPFTV